MASITQQREREELPIRGDSTGGVVDGDVTVDPAQAAPG
jgi:hypothetical protein